jgi:hypothetical protein
MTAFRRSLIFIYIYLELVKYLQFAGIVAQNARLFQLTLFVISVFVVALVMRRRLTMRLGMNNALHRLTYRRYSLIVQLPFSSEVYRK